MKKLILAMVVIAMIAMSGCVDSTFEVSYPITVDFNDSIMPNYVYILQEDGTFDIDMMGDVSTDGSWVVTEQTENSITYELTFEGELFGVLTLYEGNTFLTSSIIDGEISPFEVDGTWYVGEPIIEQIEVSGYQSYVDDEYEFSILYPEMWETSNFYSQEEAKTIEYTGTPIGILQEGQEAGIGFKSDILNSIGQPQATIMVMVVSDSEQARTWETEEFQKMRGEHSEVVINGKHGDEVLVHPFPGVMMRQVIFAVGELYYTVMVYANDGMYYSYADIFDTVISSFEISASAPIVASTSTPTPTPTPIPTPTPTPEVKKSPTYLTVLLDPIAASVKVGQPLVVTGTTNREEGCVLVVTCKGPMELVPQTARVENGKFSATFDTSGAKIGTYTVEADDGDGHTDETTVRIY